MIDLMPRLCLIVTKSNHFANKNISLIKTADAQIIKLNLLCYISILYTSIFFKTIQ